MISRRKIHSPGVSGSPGNSGGPGNFGGPDNSGSSGGPGNSGNSSSSGGLDNSGSSGGSGASGGPGVFGTPGGAQRRPWGSLLFLGIVAAACILGGALAPYPSDYMDSAAVSQPPGGEHLLGTDHMGRDLFSLLLHGGRASLYIGILSGSLSTLMAVLYGTVSGLAGERASDLMMRLAEMIMSIPSILLVLFLQAIWGTATPTSIAVVIAMTSWMNISKVVRSEVRQIRNSDYILAARTMKAPFGYILLRHLLPGFVSAIMFMAVSNIGQAMLTESTLSFLGLGLPLTTVSWGSLMSMSQNVLLSGCWWMILIPGLILVATLTSITSIGEYIRKKNNRLYSNL